MKSSGEEHEETTLRALLAGALLALPWFAGPAAQAQAVKVLVFHGPPDATTTGRPWTTHQGARHGQRLQRRRDAGRDGHQRRQPRQLPRGRVPQHGRQPAQRRAGGRAAAASSRAAAASSASAAPRRARPARVLRRADRRPAGAGEPDDDDRADRHLRRPRASRHARRCRCCGTAPTSGTSGRRARRARSTRVARYRAPTRAGRRRHGHRRHRPRRSPGAATSAAAAPSTPAWAAPPRATPRPTSRTHLLGAIQWTAGLVRGNCKATINSNYRGTRILSAGAESTGLATAGESHGLTVAPTAGCIYIGRGDCRTDPERGALLGAGAFGRILDHANPNVGIGCGSVHIFDPAQYTGAENSGVTLRRQARGLRRRRPGRRAHRPGRPQDGVRPARRHRRRPTSRRPATSTCSTSRASTRPARRPACRSSGASRRCRARASRASRSTSRPRSSTSSSEVVVFEYDAQIYSCCHVGGGMGFDSEGNLYVTTGDTNSSQGTNGYSGNNPPPKCPTGPADDAVEPALRRCELLLPGRAPNRGQHQRLQRQDAAVQADTDAPRRLEADGGRRARRTRCRRGFAQRPEPVQGRRGQRQPGQARDLRHGPAQPEPAVDRPQDRRALHGMGRPRRERAEPDRRPVDLRERGAGHPRRQLWLALLHGQQAGLPRPHRRRHAADDQRGRLRPRRSGHRRHRRLVRLRQPRQRLDRTTPA